MELVPIIKTLLFYGTIIFVTLIVISYVLSKIKNSSKRDEQKDHDLVPNYLNKPIPKQNIRVIKSEVKTKTVERPVQVKRVTREIPRTQIPNPKREYSEPAENSNIYYIKSHSKPQRQTRLEEIQSGPTMRDLKVSSQAKRFVVLNSNSAVEASTDGILNRFSKTYSYGR